MARPSVPDWQSWSPKVVYSAMAQDEGEDCQDLELAGDAAEAAEPLLARAGNLLAGS